MSAQVIPFPNAISDARLAARHRLRCFRLHGLRIPTDRPGYLGIISLMREVQRAGLPEIVDVTPMMAELDALVPHEDGLGLAPVVPFNGPAVTPFRSLAAVWIYYTAERDHYRAIQDGADPVPPLLTREEANRKAGRQYIGAKRAPRFIREIEDAIAYSAPRRAIAGYYAALRHQRAEQEGQP